MKNCDQFAPLLSAYSDRELSTTQSLLVRQHLFECEACAAEVKTLEGIRGLMLEMPAAPEPRLSFDQLVAATRPRPVRRTPLIISIACVALIASLFAPAMMRADKIAPPKSMNQELEREIARDQMIDAEADPTSGAPLVHLTGYSR
ncbi:MAG: zf-HC2 domain-containing protein [Armatimonadota bacterium]